MPVCPDAAQAGSGVPRLHRSFPHLLFHFHSAPSTAPSPPLWCLIFSWPLRAVLAPTTARSRVTWSSPFCFNTVSKWLTQRERGEAPDTCPRSPLRTTERAPLATHMDVYKKGDQDIKGMNMAQELPTHREECLQDLLAPWALQARAKLCLENWGVD